MACKIPNYIEISNALSKTKDYLTSVHHVVGEDIKASGVFEKGFTSNRYYTRSIRTDSINKSRKWVADYNNKIKEIFGIKDKILTLKKSEYKGSTQYESISIDATVLKTYHEKLVDLRDSTKLITADVERGSEPDFYTGNYQKESNYGFESLQGLSNKILRLKKNFNTNVVLDSDMKELGRVDPYEAGETPTVRINPILVNKDTVIHEFGHVYINLLGGNSDSMIAEGIAQLKGSELWNKVALAYSSLTEKELGEEVLATAIGLEGAEIFDDYIKRSKFSLWLDNFFNKLKSLIGIPRNVAKELAKEMFGNKLRTGTPKGINYYQKQKLGTQDEVYNKLFSANSEFTSGENSDVLIKDGVPYTNISKLVSTDFPRNTLQKKSYERSVLEIFKLVNNNLDLGSVKTEFKKEQDKSKFGYLTFLNDTDIESVYTYCKKFKDKFTEEGKKVLIGNTVVDDRDNVNIAGNIQISTVSQKGKVDIYNLFITLGSELTTDSIVAEQSLQVEALKNMGIQTSSIYTLPIRLVEDRLIPNPYVENTVNKEYIKKYLSIQLSPEAITKVANTAKELVGVLQRKVSIISRTIESKTPIQKERFDEFKQTVADLADAEQTKVITSFLDTATREVLALEKRLQSTIQKDDFTLEDLRTIYEYSQAYSSVKEVSELLRDPSIAEEFKDTNYINQIDIVKRHIDNITSTYKKYAKIALARSNKKESKIFTARRIELEREFNKIEIKKYSSLKGDQLKQKKLEYINKHIADEYNILIQEEEDRIVKLLTDTDSDIGAVDLWVTDSRNLNDELLQLLENKLSVADFTVTSATQDVYSDVDTIFKEVITLKSNTTDQKKLYEESLETYESKTTGYYVSQYFSEFDKQKKVVWDKYYSFENKDSSEALKAYTEAVAWNKDNIQSKYTESFQNQMDQFLSADDTNYKVNRILAKYSDKSNVSDKDLAEIKTLLENKKSTPDKLKNKFYSQVDFVESESFIETKKRKSKQLGDKYDEWLSKQYYTKANTKRLLPMWSELSPKDKSVLNPDKGLPKNKWVNPQYKKLEELRKQDSSVAKLYDKLISYNLEADNLVPLAQRLGYKLPSIEKSTIERVSDKGPWFAIREGFLNSFRKTNLDIDLGEEQGVDKKQGINSLRNVVDSVINVFTTEAGREKKAIPIHYRKDLTNLEDQSYDLATLCLANYQTCKNYSEKTKVALDLEVAKDLVYERQVNQYTPDGKLKLDNFTGKAVKKEGTSNTYKAIESLLDTRLYGIRMLGDASFNKKVGQLNNWASGTVMILNYLSAPANLLHGKVTSLIESVSSTYYNTTNLKNGEAEYAKDTKNILGDIGNRRPNSKTNILLERFNVLDSFDVLHNRFSENSKASNLLKVNSLYSFQTGGEHMIQGSVMYAYLDTIKVTNSESVTVKFTDAIDIVDGKIKAKEGYEDAVKPEQLYNISASIARILSHQFGNYSSTNISQLQRFAVGNMVVSLKKFFVGGAKRRYRGISNIKNRIGEDNYNTQHYDPVLGHYVEGDYITTIRTLRTMYQDFKTLKMQAIGQTWEGMTDIEKGRFKRTMIELNIALLAFTLSMLLKGDKDDDEEETTTQLMGAFLTRRLYSELSFWVNPIEIGRTLRSPAQSLSFSEKIFRLLGQLTNPMEEYTKGKRKGDKKIFKKIADITPIYSQINRNLAESVDFLYK